MYVTKFCTEAELIEGGVRTVDVREGMEYGVLVQIAVGIRWNVADISKIGICTSASNDTCLQRKSTSSDGLAFRPRRIIDSVYEILSIE